MNANKTIDLQNTYKAVVALEFIENDVKMLLDEMRTITSRYQNKGIIPKSKLRKISLIGMPILAIICFCLDFFVHGQHLSKLLFIPLYAEVATFIVLVAVIPFCLYNKIRFVINKRNFNKKGIEQQKYLLEELEIIEENRKTLTNMLKHSVIPSKYQNKNALDFICQQLNTKKARTINEAIKQFEYQHLKK